MKKHIAYILLIIIVGLFAFGFGIGKRDLWAPDEPRFGQAAREMIMRSDPFVLHVNDEPYSDKPPLHIWMTAAITLAQKTENTMVTPFAVRFPAVFGGFIGLLATYALGTIIFRSPKTGLLSALILATSFMFSYQASRAQLDMLMSGWSYISVLAFWMALHANISWKKYTWWALFWIMGALGTLSKGPPAIIVPIGTAAFFLMWEPQYK